MTSGYLHNWRDSEGKGLIGCMFFIVVFALAIYLGIMLGPVYYANFNFESQIETEAGRAGAKFLDDETIIKDILDLAKRNEIRLNRQNIKIDRFAGQVAHVDEGQLGSVQVEKGPHVAVDPPRQHGQGVRVEQRCGQQRSQRVEISLFVGEDHVHGLIVSDPRSGMEIS